MLFIVEGLAFGYITYQLGRGLEKLLLLCFTFIFILATCVDPILFSYGWFFAPHSWIVSILCNGYCYGCAVVGLLFRK